VRLYEITSTGSKPGLDVYQVLCGGFNMVFEVVVITASIIITYLLFNILSKIEKILKSLCELNACGKNIEKLLALIGNNINDIKFNTSNLDNIICVNSDEPMNKDEPKLHDVFYWIEEIHRMLTEICEQRGHIRKDEG
jgi:hypothetical protein